MWESVWGECGSVRGGEERCVERCWGVGSQHMHFSPHFPHQGRIQHISRGVLKKNFDPALRSGSKKFWWGDEILN